MLRRLIGFLVLAMVVLASVQVVGADSIADHVVISEVYVNAINETGNSRSEFVEFYNPTDTGINLNGWNLTDLEGAIALSDTIPAYGFYLIGMKGYNGYKDNATQIGSYGPAWDTDNNSADFFIQDSPNPQNSGADPLPPVPKLSTIILLSTGLITLAGYVLLTKRRN